jgi:hypothetical protein
MAAGLPGSDRTFQWAALCLASQNLLEGAAMCNQVRWLLQRSYFTRTQKALFIIAALMVLLLLLPEHAYSNEVFLSWDPNHESNLSGYRIYYGTTSGSCFITTAAHRPADIQLLNFSSDGRSP